MLSPCRRHRCCTAYGVQATPTASVKAVPTAAYTAAPDRTMARAAAASKGAEKGETDAPHEQFQKTRQKQVSDLDNKLVPLSIARCMVSSIKWSLALALRSYRDPRKNDARILGAKRSKHLDRDLEKAGTNGFPVHQRTEQEIVVVRCPLHSF